MEWASSEVLTLLYYLLPGLFTAWIFYGLTAHRRPTPFERVVQALIFTGIVQVPVLLIEWALVFVGQKFSLGTWTESNGFATSMCLAGVLGPLFAWIANNDLLHGFLRDSKWSGAITKRTAYPSEWFSALNADKRWLLLHLDDGRRIFGWPYEWPDHSDSGHFVLMKPEWVLDDNTRVPLYDVERMLIAAADVKFVDILKRQEEIEVSQAEQERVVQLVVEHNRTIEENEEDQPDDTGVIRNGQ